MPYIRGPYCVEAPPTSPLTTGVPIYLLDENFDSLRVNTTKMRGRGFRCGGVKQAYPSPLCDTDETHLADLGYKQEFRRAFTAWESFGIAFSIIGLLPSMAYVSISSHRRNIDR